MRDLNSIMGDQHRSQTCHTTIHVSYSACTHATCQKLVILQLWTIRAQGVKIGFFGDAELNYMGPRHVTWLYTCPTLILNSPITMAQMAKYGTEGQAKNIIACTIFVWRPIRKLMVPMERLSLKYLFYHLQKILFHLLPPQNWGKALSEVGCTSSMNAKTPS